MAVPSYGHPRAAPGAGAPGWSLQIRVAKMPTLHGALWLSRHSRVGHGAGSPWDRGRGPCPWQEWNKVHFRVPPHPNHSGLLGFSVFTTQLGMGKQLMRKQLCPCLIWVFNSVFLAKSTWVWGLKCPSLSSPSFRALESPALGKTKELASPAVPAQRDQLLQLCPKELLPCRLCPQLPGTLSCRAQRGGCAEGLSCSSPSWAARAGSILQEFSLIWLSLAESFTSLSGVWVGDCVQSGRCFARGLL